MRATDEEHVRSVRNQREQTAEHGGRRSDTGSVMHSVQHAPTCNTTTTTIPRAVVLTLKRYSYSCINTTFGQVFKRINTFFWPGV